MDQDKTIKQYIPVWRTWNRFTPSLFGYGMRSFVGTFNKNKRDLHKWKLYEWLFE
jgi:hypothetical protein